MKYLLIILLFISVAADATNYYVSNSGNDSNDGLTTSTPFLTASKGFSVVTSGDSLFFERGGSFFITAMLNATSNVYYGAYGTGDKPVLTVLKTVPSLEQSGNIYSATVTDNAPVLNTVLINGVVGFKARYPNTHYLTYLPGSTATTLTISNTDTASVQVGNEIAVRDTHWLINNPTVTSKSGNIITFSPALTYYPNYGCNGWFPMNDSTFLDSSLEWSYKTNRLKVFCSSGTPTVQYSTLDTAIRISSKSNITFENLTFEGCNKEYFIIDTSSNITIINCNLKRVGRNGVRAKKSNHLLFYNDSLYDCLSGALQLGTIVADSCFKVTVQNCYFKRTAIYAGMGYGDNGTYEAIIGIGDSGLITGNTGDSTGYIPINHVGIGDSIYNNFIGPNQFIKDDGGGIYSAGFFYPDSGTVIEGNIITQGKGAPDGTDLNSSYNISPAAGIYLDGSAAYVTIKNNIIVGNTGALFLNNSTHITSSGNIYDDSSLTNFQTIRLFGTLSNITFHNDIFIQRNSSKYLLDGLSSSISASDSNYWIRPSDTANIIRNGSTPLSLSGWRTATSFDTHSNQSPLLRLNNNILTIYNPTSSDSMVMLQHAYIDVYGNIYPGALPFKLSAYSGKVLFRYNKEFFETKSLLIINH